MHFKDQMTPNERMEAYFAGKDVDRLPAMPFIGPIPEMTCREIRSSAENIAKSQILTYEKIGMDGLTVDYLLNGGGHALGSTWSDPIDTAPIITTPALSSLKDVDQLDPEMARPENDPWLRRIVEACDICVSTCGNEVATSISMPGPFTIASSVFPIAKLLRSTVKDPENLHKLLKICTEVMKIVADATCAVGAEPFICDPVASGVIINERTYREFVLPYTVDFIEHVHKKEIGVGYHICGDTSKITRAMLESGCDMLSVDAAVDLAYAKEVAGHKVPILGNVDPIHTMLEGTVADIEADMKRCLRKAADSPNGYIICTGCEVPYGTKDENLHGFMDAARKYGKWPLQPELWED